MAKKAIWFLIILGLCFWQLGFGWLPMGVMFGIIALLVLWVNGLDTNKNPGWSTVAVILILLAFLVLLVGAPVAIGLVWGSLSGLVYGVITLIGVVQIVGDVVVDVKTSTASH